MHEFLNEGTVIHTKIFYTLQRGKRHYKEKKPEKVNKKAIFGLSVINF